MKNKSAIILGIIVGLALLLRLLVCYQLAETPSVQNPMNQTDMATYLRLASDVRHGIFPDHFDYQPFYYTCFLPFLVSSSSKCLMFIMQSLAGAGAVFLAGLIGNRVYGRRWGWLCALLLCLSRMHIFYTPFALYEVLQSFWIALLFYLLLLAWRHNTSLRWLLCGLVLSVTILTRGNAVLFLPVILLGIILRNHRNWRRIGIFAGIVLLAAYIPQLPFSITNYRYTGHWCGPSTAADKVLALGNTPEAPAAGLAYPLTYSKWVDDSDQNGRTVSSRILEWFCKNPLEFFEIKFRTLLHFWDSQEVPNNVSLSHDGEPYSAILRFGGLVNFGLLSVLAILGMFLASRRRSIPRRFLISFVLIFCAATVLFYMLGRFRIGILPLLCVLAGGAIPSFIHRFAVWNSLGQSQRRISALVTGLIILLAVYIPFSAINDYSLFFERDIHAALSPNGICAHFPGDTTLIHDHGPLPTGINGYTLLSPGTHRITKQFAIPAEVRSAILDKPMRVRFFILPQPGLQPQYVKITHGQETKSPEVVKLYAFTTWLEVQFDHLEEATPGIAECTFEIPAEANAAACVDTLRYYGRTVEQKNDALARLPYEFVAEIQW